MAKFKTASDYSDKAEKAKFIAAYNDTSLSNGAFKKKMGFENPTPVSVLLRSETVRAQLTCERTFKDGDDAMPKAKAGAAAGSRTLGKKGGSEEAGEGNTAALQPFSFTARLYDQPHQFSGTTKKAAMAQFFGKLQELNFSKMEFLRSGSTIGLDDISNGDTINVRKQMTAAA